MNTSAIPPLTATELLDCEQDEPQVEQEGWTKFKTGGADDEEEVKVSIEKESGVEHMSDV